MSGTINTWDRLWRSHERTKGALGLGRHSWMHLSSWMTGEPLEDSSKSSDATGASASPVAKGSSGTGGEPRPEKRDYSTRQLVGLIVGPILFAVMLASPTPEAMGAPAQKMAAVALLMATWWMTEALPIPATSLLPIPLFPLLGIMGTQKATSPYASHLIFLFMGGFIIALAMQRWSLHRRMAMNVIRLVGFSPPRLILGFMVATAGLSAFVSNTATTVMMMPIGLAVISHVKREGKKEGLDATIDFSPERFSFGLNLMLGIAYAASIGGMATIIGTPPNTVLVAYVQKTYGYEITFVEWMKVGIPLVCVLLPLCWLWLTRLANPMVLKKVPGGRDLIERELESMGRLSVGERWTLLVFLLTALGWILRPKLESFFEDPSMLSDATIAMTGALALFVLPVRLSRGVFAMNWEWAQKVPWGVLLLFGGGLSLAEGFKTTHLADWMGAQLSLLAHAPHVLLIVSITILLMILTELTSNTATSAMVMPMLAAMAIGAGQNPLLLMFPAAIAASCAFMLPVATPPNAIVFGSGYVTIPQMVRSGVGLNVIGILVTTAVTYLVALPVFGITIGQLPAWLNVP